MFLNPELIERVLPGGNTLICLANGNRLPVLEPSEDVIRRILIYRRLLAQPTHNAPSGPLGPDVSQLTA